MKSLGYAAAFFVITLVFSACNSYYLTAFFTRMEERLAGLDSENAAEALTEAEKTWEAIEPYLTVTVRKSKLQAVPRALGEARIYAEAGEEAAFAAAIAEAREELRSLAKEESLRWGNVL